MAMIRQMVIIVLALLMIGCAQVQTTKSGVVGIERKQSMSVLISSEAMEKAAHSSYSASLQEANESGKLDVDKKQTGKLKAILDKMIPQVSVFKDEAVNWNWDVHVVKSDIVNATCAPGGKITFYSGIMDRLKLEDAEIAAVMGHEISHALREHSRERMSEELIKRIGVSVVGAAAKVDTNKLDAVANLVITLPHSREHESEADVMGIELAARAGYDPRAAISVWKKMSALGGKQPLQFMSTHPAHETRIAELEKYMPKVLPLYEETVKQRPKPKGKRRAPSRVAGLQ